MAKEFTQREGIDYNETFSPVSYKDFFRIIMALDEGMTPRSSIFAYLVPAKEEARSRDTRSPQGPALRLGVQGKKYL
jgi:hypothetical protein